MTASVTTALTADTNSEPLIEADMEADMEADTAEDTTKDTTDVDRLLETMTDLGTIEMIDVDLLLLGTMTEAEATAIMTDVMTEMATVTGTIVTGTIREAAAVDGIMIEVVEGTMTALEAPRPGEGTMTVVGTLEMKGTKYPPGSAAGADP